MNLSCNSKLNHHNLERKKDQRSRIELGYSDLKENRSLPLEVKSDLSFLSGVREPAGNR